MLQCTFIKVSHLPPLQVTGWVLMPELVPVSLSGARISCGLQLAWSQDEMTLLAGGDTRVVRLWDCARETRVCDLATQLDTCVTCIQSGHADSRHVAAVSFGDGHVKVYDTRARAAVMTAWEHQQMVLGL